MTHEAGSCLDAIAAFVATRGCAPTVKQLAAQMSISDAVATDLVERLEAAGRVRLTRRRHYAHVIEPILANGATPSVVAAAWKVLDAWMASKLPIEEMRELAKALDPERFA